MALFCLDKVIIATPTKIDDAIWEKIKPYLYKYLFGNIEDIEIIDMPESRANVPEAYSFAKKDGTVVRLSHKQTQIVRDAVTDLKLQLKNIDAVPTRYEVSEMARDAIKRQRVGVIELSVLITILLPLIVKLIEIWIDGGKK